MSYRVILRSEATQDLADAFDWYEAREPGLGIKFIAAVEVALSTIEESPLAFATVHHSIRRILLRKFPYGIYYVIKEDRFISILACFHAKRAPAWKKRLP